MPNFLKIAVLTFLIFANLTYAREYEHFHFTHIVDKTPYIIINDPEMLTELQTHLTNSLLGKQSLAQSHFYLDTTQVEWVKGFFLYGIDPELQEKMKCYEIKSHEYSRWRIPQKFIIQFVNSRGDGIQKEIFASKFLYHSSRYGAFIIVKCDPIDIQEDALKWKYGTSYPLPTYTHTFWKQNIPQHSAGETPKIIQGKAKQLAASFFEAQPRIFPTGSDEENKKLQKFSIAPIRHFQNTEEIYYCALMAYGHKGYICKLYLFNQSGEVVETLSNDEFVRILGTTDVNRDGSHELIVFYSAGDYSGGFQTLALEKNDLTGSVQFVVKSKMMTFFD